MSYMSNHREIIDTMNEAAKCILHDKELIDGLNKEIASLKSRLEAAKKAMDIMAKALDSCGEDEDHEGDLVGYFDKNMVDEAKKAYDAIKQGGK